MKVAVIEVFPADVRRTAARTFFEHVRAHGGRRRFAVAAGNPYRIIEAGSYQMQKLRPAEYGNVPPPRFNEFRVVLRDRRVHDDRVRNADALGSMAVVHGYPRIFQFCRHASGGNVASGNAKALFLQKQGKAAHADPADPDEINIFFLRPKFPLHGIFICPKRQNLTKSGKFFNIFQFFFK